MQIKKHIVKYVAADSIGSALEITPGDAFIAINGKAIDDIFDYHFLVNDEYIELLIEKPDGEQWELEIEKELDEDLGVQFENGLMDQYRTCNNDCIFCFIDQMPKGMRETLYFKDDDSRLSFLQGNYVTLTNMRESDINRIIQYKLAPINISFHTTNPKLRCQMLHNRFAGSILDKVTLLYEAGIEMNGQIVLCKGVNDGTELVRSIKDLSKFQPHLRSVSVVPVGLTKYRDGLAPLEPFHTKEAKEVLNIIHTWQERLYKEYGNHFIHAGDEWYLLAGEEFPIDENYDGYQQLENGVGMVRLLVDEVAEELAAHAGDMRKRTISIATGVSAYESISCLINQIQAKYPNITVHLYKVKNHFFGERITVAGLLTAGDIMEQLRGCSLGERLLLTDNVLRDGENIFLDDITVEEMENALQVKIDIVKSSGTDFVNTVVK